MKKREEVKNNMKIKILTIFSIALLALLSSVGIVTAHSENSGPGNAENGVIEVREDRSGPSINSGEFRLEIEDEDIDDEVFEINNNDFEITGAVESISGNTFMVAGQTIVIDPAMVENFEQEVALAVGTMVKAEGIVADGTLFVREIELPEGIENDPDEDEAGEQEFRLEVKGVPATAVSMNLFEQIVAFLQSLR